MIARQPTVEWQVCGICNYACGYCIQSPRSRTGQPRPGEVDAMLAFLAGLRGSWEIKMTGGEPFAFGGFMNRIVPELVSSTSHVLSVLTNLSAPMPVLERFTDLARRRIGIVSASFHPEHTKIEEFAAKAAAFRRMLDEGARMVVNMVVVPGQVDRVAQAKRLLDGVGLRLFPQIMKVGAGITEYDAQDRAAIHGLLGDAPGPREANVAPSYRGRSCHAGADYFVLTQTGDAWSCRTARRFREGFLGNAIAGGVRLREHASPCPYDICPCTVPANRGMIEGVGA